MRPVSKLAWNRFRAVRWTIVSLVLIFCYQTDFPYRSTEGWFNVLWGQICIGFGVYAGVTFFAWYMSATTILTSEIFFSNNPYYRAWSKTRHPYYDTEYRLPWEEDEPTIEEVQAEKEELEPDSDFIQPMRNPRPSDN